MTKNIVLEMKNLNIEGNVIDNGWIEEMTWLKRPRNYNQKWTREKVFEVSKKFSTRGGFKKEYKSAYNVARINGWLDEMTWLTSIRKK